MKKLIIIIIGVLAIAGFFYLNQHSSPEIVKNEPQGDYKNISYVIEGETIPLHDGTYEAQAAPGSVEKVDTEYFGNETKGDFNNDGREDVAFVLTQSGGGTGSFFYVVAALKTADGYQGTNAIFLGDRIAPQTTEFRGGQIIVNYADRKPGEPLSADPSVGVSKYLKVSADKLVEVSK